MVFTVCSSCRFIDEKDIDLGVVDLHDSSSGRDAAYCLPARYLVALTPFASLRFTADLPPIDAIDARLDRPAVVLGSGKSFARSVP